MKEAGFSAVLSFIFSGLGQIYNGQIKKGIIIMTFSVIGILLTLVGAVVMGCSLLFNLFEQKWIILGGVLFIIGIAEIAIFGIYSIWDAYKVGCSNSPTSVTKADLKKRL